MKVIISIMAALMLIAVIIVTVMVVKVNDTLNKATEAASGVTVTVDEYMRGMQLDVSGYERDGKNYLIFTTNKGNMCVVPVE